mgnify:CR=1 FL=1|jgi:hypothetical protein
MNTTHQTTVIEGGKNRATTRETTIKENKMTITEPKLIRWAGLVPRHSGN